MMHLEVSDALEGCDECERSLDVGHQWWDERDDGGRGSRRHSLVRVQVGESIPAVWRGGAGRVVAEAGAQSHSDIRDTGERAGEVEAKASFVRSGKAYGDARGTAWRASDGGEHGRRDSGAAWPGQTAPIAGLLRLH